MLKLLRKYSRSWLIAVASGAIVVVFIFWGIGGLQSPRFQEVASVNGEPIFLTAHVRQYNLLVKDFQERAKGELTEEQLPGLALPDPERAGVGTRQWRPIAKFAAGQVAPDPLTGYVGRDLRLALRSGRMESNFATLSPLLF